MNELETQLRSWAPRRPSAKLRRRIFAAGAAGAIGEGEPTFRFGWLAPATAAFLLMAVLFNQRNSPVISGSSNSGPMVAMIMSNQSAAAYLPGSFQSDHNKLAGETFEWTNGSRSTSSIRSLSHPRGSNE
jgi:hypothetical protein